MVKGKLDQREFNKRCSEVFCSYNKDEYYDITIDDNNTVIINMGEFCKDKPYMFSIFNYKPDMSQRPQALDYLLGNREDFND